MTILSESRIALPSPADQAGTRPDGRSVCVVVPIPNDPPWELFDEIPADIPILVSDDSDGKISPPTTSDRRLGENVFYLDYAAQQAYCGEHYAAMPHKSAASRNVGHYVAWKEGFDIIIALDYDCLTRPGWLRTHLDALTTVTDAPAVTSTQPNGWVNPIRQTFPNGDIVYARGYPYEWRTPELAVEDETLASGRVALNLGVWDGILDLNGIDKLYQGEPGDPGVDPLQQSTIALSNIPICGMNTAFLSELTPAYFFLPDISINGWNLSRHDDIWGGYLVKRLMDVRGDLLAFGGPVVGHTKQTTLERVVVMEQWMHVMSMPFYDLVDEAAANVAPAPYETMMLNFVEEYDRALSVSTAPVHYRQVFGQLGDWLGRWARAFG